MWLAILISVLSGCNLERTIEIDLPAHESLLVLEGYVEPNKLFVSSLFETVSYFDDVNVPIFSNAVVALKGPGWTDTLDYIPLDRGLGFFKGHRIIPEDFNHVYRLEATDVNGRHAWGEAKVEPQVTIDSVAIIWAADSTATLNLYFHDDPNQPNYYFYWARKSTEPNEATEWTYFKDNLFNGTYYAHPTVEKYIRGDVVTIRLIHISYEYYEFARTLDQANSINSDILQEPLNVKSNIHGGLGIFTGFKSHDLTVKIE